MQARLERIGQGVLAPSQGLSALRAVLQLQGLAGSAAVPQVAVNPFNWGSYLPQMTQPRSRFFEAFAVGGVASEQLPASAAVRKLVPASVDDVLATVSSVLESIVGASPTPYTSVRVWGVGYRLRGCSLP